MQLSCTTRDINSDLVRVLNLTMSKDSDIVPFIPGYLDGLGDVIEELKVWSILLHYTKVWF